MAGRDFIPIRYLRECFSYDAETGILRWRERPRSHFPDRRSRTVWNLRWIGKEAGSLRKNGTRHVCITIKGKQRGVFTHRAAWALTTGEYPSKEIVHGDADRANNRFRNLVPVTHADACA